MVHGGSDRLASRHERSVPVELWGCWRPARGDVLRRRGAIRAIRAAPRLAAESEHSHGAPRRSARTVRRQAYASLTSGVAMRRSDARCWRRVPQAIGGSTGQFGWWRLPGACSATRRVKPSSGQRGPCRAGRVFRLGPLRMALHYVRDLRAVLATSCVSDAGRDPSCSSVAHRSSPRHDARARSASRVKAGSWTTTSTPGPGTSDGLDQNRLVSTGPSRSTWPGCVMPASRWSTCASAHRAGSGSTTTRKSASSSDIPLVLLLTGVCAPAWRPEW